MALVMLNRIPWTQSSKRNKNQKGGKSACFAAKIIFYAMKLMAST